MAEQEVIKHTKKIFTVWGGKEHGFWYKAKEFILEIIIIVFAVSLSIWLHGKSEHKHQQKDVKEFLLGLREDLQSDIIEMEEDKSSYKNQGKTFSYISSAKMDQPLEKDSLKKYQQWMFNTTRLQMNNGRFEGFKSSGKIGLIEDKVLQDDIMDLYQENIPALLASTDAYIHRKAQFLEYGIRNRKRLTDSTTNILTMLHSDEAQNIAGFLSNPIEIIDRYDICINKMKAIVAEIEDKYGLKKK